MYQIVAALMATLLLLTQAASTGRIANLRDYKRAMVTMAEALEVIESSTASNIYLLNSVRGDALTRHDIIRERLSAVRAFFVDQGTSEAARLADATLASLDDLRVELAAAEPNEAAASEAVTHLRAQCAACHDAYREGDSRSGYRFKR
jgi:hypothetical protein